jgi:ATP-dependent 26S proteasome regulatory subunit
MNQSVRTFVWTVLIAGGVGLVILMLIFTQVPFAVASAVGVVATWIAWGFLSSHLVGIRRHVARHLGPNWFKGEVLRHRIRTGERVDLQVALDRLRLRDAPSRAVFGLPVSPIYPNNDDEGGPVAELVALIQSNLEPEPIVWESLPRSAGQTLNCANNALYLLQPRKQPVVVFVQGRSRGPRKQALLQVLARTREIAQDALDEVLKVARQNSVYKGAIISVQRSDARREDFSVEFHDLPAVEREGIVLPEEVLQVVERNLFGFLKHAEALRQAGHGTRHGILLHGPPGTGKTLVTRYLAGRCAPYTVLLLTGRQYAFLRPTCALARLLAPSLVVLEDVDLIAADRRSNLRAPLLHELMDEMDGLGAGADCIFLLTTNRPESLETALSARPGRVDQAIYFPLPDLECRRRLFAQFSTDMDVSGVDFEPLLERTAGASPAFLKELFRRAALMAAERGEHTRPLRLTDEDFRRGLRELVEFGGELTRNFLGFPAGRG